MAFLSHTLRKAVLDYTGGSIEHSTAFSSVAEEFGIARDPDTEVGCLRELLNKKNLKPGDPDCVVRNEPHELSQVVSGALYTVMVKIHKKLKDQYAKGDSKSEFSVSGKALAVGALQFKRMIFRALDYLPPGEVSFADYGRAIIAADKASHPADEEERTWIEQEFVSRFMVTNSSALNVKTNFEYQALKEVDLQTLVDSDWAAYQFANDNRRLFRIPKGVPFHVEPRLDASKLYYHRGGERVTVRECLFKVRWTQTEPNSINRRWPWKRRISVGTTLAIDWQTGKVRVLLTTDRRRRPEEEEEQQHDRDLFLRRLAEEDLMRLDDRARAHDGQPLGSIVQAESLEGVLKAKGTARMLHVIGEG